jgi:hypothetical protein
MNTPSRWEAESRFERLVRACVTPTRSKPAGLLHSMLLGKFVRATVEEIGRRHPIMVSRATRERIVREVIEHWAATAADGESYE